MRNRRPSGDRYRRAVSNRGDRDRLAMGYRRQPVTIEHLHRPSPFGQHGPRRPKFGKTPAHGFIGELEKIAQLGAGKRQIPALRHFGGGGQQVEQKCREPLDRAPRTQGCERCRC